MSEQRRTTTKGDDHAAEIHLLLGDPVVADPQARQIIDRLLTPERQQVDLEIVRLPDDDIDRAISLFAQVGMFGEGRCIWIRGLGTEKAEAGRTLLAFLSGEDGQGGVPRGSSLVASSAHIDQRGRLFKWFKANAHIVDLRLENDRSGRPREDDVVEFARLRIADAGLPAPAPAALRLIAERAGSGLGQLAQEIDKLCLACDDGATIEPKLVRRMMRDQAQAWVYDLTNAISKRDGCAAQQTIDRLLSQGEPPLRVLATLATHIAVLIEAGRLLPTIPPAALRNAGSFAREHFARLPDEARGYFKSGFRAFYALEGAKAFRGRELRRLHHQLLEVDMRLKTTTLAPAHLLFSFIQRACAGSH